MNAHASARKDRGPISLDPLSLSLSLSRLTHLTHFTGASSKPVRAGSARVVGRAIQNEVDSGRVGAQSGAALSGVVNDRESKRGSEDRWVARVLVDGDVGQHTACDDVIHTDNDAAGLQRSHTRQGRDFKRECIVCVDVESGERDREVSSFVGRE